ncbi:MAG: hypothetical protein M0Z46_10095 [Actinomycetota bacterium]|jgi:hypothetical protein|nr:hypothetical protein [Actinomycetota bacterium]
MTLVIEDFSPKDLYELFDISDATDTLDVIDLQAGGRFGPLFTSTRVRRAGAGASEFLVGFWAHIGTDTEATSASWNAWPRCYSLQLAWKLESNLAAVDAVDKLLWATGYHPDHPAAKADRRAGGHIAAGGLPTAHWVADIAVLAERAERNKSLDVATAAGLPAGMTPRRAHCTTRYEP